MSTGTVDGALKLVSMANQIAGFFRPYPKEQAVGGIAEHIAKFWDHKMRATIIDHLDHGGAGLEPDVREALDRLKAKV
ncbi:MAG: formate dehydrogenase subunit delta [Beijerinckiaceae bacterium]|nr:formate dehydrogenase subunit delta [Beijerinckiaceae bacterium]